MIDFKKIYYITIGGVRKNIKLTYFAKGVYRLLQPKFYCLWKRKHILKHFDRLSKEQQNYVLDRVNYYCKLSSPTSLKPSVASTIGQHTFRNKKGGSVYFFDSHEYARLFPDNLKWAIAPGDITRTFDCPTIVKSRPIREDGSNANSVILNMDKVRHFMFINDPFSFREKRNKVIFRGACHGKPNRQMFIEKFHDNPLCDLKDSSTNSINPEEWQVKKEMDTYDHLKFKFIMALEGNEVASNLKWVMSSNSLAVSPKLNYETWYMEGKLIPGYHFVEVAPDFSDFKEKINYYITHPEEAEAIIKHAHEYVSQFQDKKIEQLISVMVMDKYLKLVNETDN